MTTIHNLTRSLAIRNDTKIILLVADGLGGLPLEPGGKTELETADTPILDRIAKQSVLGMSIPVLPGITAGSGPGHLGLFGYDPLEYNIGRGVLESLGIDFPLESSDVAIRGNFCSLDASGKISDRRAGRIASEVGAKLCKKLDRIEIPGVDIFVKPVKEYRLVVIFRGQGLEGNVHDTDPQQTGVKPREANASESGSARTAEVCNEFLKQAKDILANDTPANFLTLRGIARKPAIPTFEELYSLKSAAIAVYPMYRGLARLVGMDILDAGQTLVDQVQCLKSNWHDYDFFFMHYKYTDSTGEDGNFREKVARIEELDAIMTDIVLQKPDVLIVTGDHSTPCKMRSHSWHPVPVLLSAENCRFDGSASFGESACRQGELGQFEAKYLMLHALAHAGRLGKYGA